MAQSARAALPSSRAGQICPIWSEHLPPARAHGTAVFERRMEVAWLGRGSGGAMIAGTGSVFAGGRLTFRRRRVPLPHELYCHGRGSSEASAAPIPAISVAPGAVTLRFFLAGVAAGFPFADVPALACFEAEDMHFLALGSRDILTMSTPSSANFLLRSPDRPLPRS